MRATDEVIAETKSEKTPFAHILGTTPSQHVEKLIVEKLRCGDVYEAYVRSVIFIRDLDTLMHNSIYEYWACKKDANLYDFAFHGTSLTRL